ncbi:MAG: flagellar hook capping FlgD N-terminal domain-containing protein [Rhodospirillales bacterium]
MSDSLTAATNAAAASYGAASTTGTSTTGTAATPNALAQLGANFNQFLQLLLTQVQNQDPTAPTDTSQFTTELVQFTGVQEQVNANSSLGQLIGLQQSSQVLQSASLVGHQATVAANQITLQSGHGEIQFQGTAGEQVDIAHRRRRRQSDPQRNRDGHRRHQHLEMGRHHRQRRPASRRRLSHRRRNALHQRTAAPIPYSVVGTTTGVSTNGTNTLLQLGALSVGLSALQSVDQ